MWEKTLIQKREQGIAPAWRGKIHRMRRGERKYDNGVLNRKMKHTFLIGMLCGVIITAAVTYVFAIPANNYHWKMEIWNRGGGAWTFDKNGHLGWKWLVEPKADAPQQKRVTAPVYKVNALTEQL